MRLFSMMKKNSKLALKNNWGGAILIILIIFGVSMLLSVLQQVAITVFVNVSPLSEMLTDFLMDPVRNLPEGLTPQMVATEYIIMGIFTLLSLLFVAPLTLGQARWFFKLVHGERLQVSDVFHFFETPRGFGRALWFNVNISVRTMLWSMLFFFVPGFILGMSVFYLSGEDLERSSTAIASTGIFLSAILMILAAIFYAACINRYALAPYLLAEDGDISARKAIKESVKFTKGFRFSLLWFELSFIGWALLSVIALPLLLYVSPYYNTAFAMYSRYIIEKNRYARPDWTQANATREFVSSSVEPPISAQTAQFTPAREPEPVKEPVPSEQSEPTQEPEPHGKDDTTPE